MASDWPLVPLGEICELFDGPHQTAPLTPGGPIVYLNVGDIRGGRIELRLSGRVSEETARAWSSRVTPRPGDVVFGYEATVGQAAMLSSDQRWCLGRRVGLLRARHGRVDPRFLLYAWYSPRFQETLRASRVGGTTIESIRLSDLPSWRIGLPDLEEQGRIAGVLGALDDKIELNRQMSETLEAVARTIFQSWFVDFDPVRAKAEGRDPIGMDREIAALFPYRFDHTDIGQIPAGWEWMPLDQLATFRNGLALQRYPPTGTDDLPVIKIPELRAGVTNSTGRAAGDVPPDYVVDNGDVLFSWSGSLLAVLWAGGPGALNQHLFRVTSDEHPRWLYYGWIREHLPRFQQIAAGKATTMGHIQRRHLTEAVCAVPDEELAARASSVLEPMLDLAVAKRVESGTLAELRDLLLPRLVSGELRLSTNPTPISNDSADSLDVNRMIAPLSNGALTGR